MSRPRKLVTALVLVALVVLGGFWGYGKLTQVTHRLTSLRSHLNALEGVDASQGLADLASMDLSALQAELAGAHEDLTALDRELGPLVPLTRYLGWVPGYGGDLAAAAPLLEIAVRVTGAGSAALEAAGPVLDMDGAGDASLQSHLATVLKDTEPVLTSVAADLDRAAQAREQLDTERLSPRVKQLVERLDQYLPLLQPGVELARLAPQLLGFDDPRTYLILAQNDDELRPTGGFISGVGVLRVEQGDIVDLTFEDSYAVDTPDENDPSPPEALSRTMWAGVWLLRDANWAPDFPTSADVAQRMFEREHDVEIDGVIAVDQQALRLLVGAVGPIESEAFEQPVTGDNVIQQIRRYWAPPGAQITDEWWLHRKDFMNIIVKGIMENIEADPDPRHLAKLGQAVWQALEEKHVLVHLEDREAAAILAQNGWDGALRPAPADYLMVVDTNVGFNKVNPNVEQRIAYHVTLQTDGAGESTVSIHHQNRSQRDIDSCVQEARYDPTYAEMMNRCYWNYLRLYVPQGSRLTDATRHPLPPGSLFAREGGADPGSREPDVGPPERGKQVFGTFFVVPPGHTETTRFEYRTPAVARQAGGRWEYHLLIQKQPGARPMPVEVTVVLPSGVEFRSAQPPATTVTNREVLFETRLDTDWELTLTYR